MSQEQIAVGGKSHEDCGGKVTRWSLNDVAQWMINLKIQSSNETA